MNKAYIAAPIFNSEQLKVVSNITMTLKLQAWDIFSPYEASRPIWKGRAPKDCTEEERALVLKGNIDNLHWAEVLVAWVGGTADGRTDTGVVWEMGYFHALKDYLTDTQRLVPPKKYTVAYVDPTDVRKEMNLMLAGTVDFVALGPAQLDRCLRLLSGDKYNEATIAIVRDLFNPAKAVMHEEAPIK